MQKQKKISLQANNWSLRRIFYFVIFSLFSMLHKKVSSMTIHKGNKMHLASNKIFEVKLGCTEIKIPNNYKKLILKLKSNSINRLLVTDEKIDLCNQQYNIKDCCAKNATFCMENSNPTLNEFRLNYCIDYTYVYACINPQDPNFKQILDDIPDSNENPNSVPDAPINPSNAAPQLGPASRINLSPRRRENQIHAYNDKIANNENEKILLDDNALILERFDIQSKEDMDNVLNKNYKIVNYLTSTNTDSAKIKPNAEENIIFGNLEIKTDIVKGEGCTTAEYLAETECATLGLLNCLDQNKCNKECVYVECRKDYEDTKSKVFSMCLPQSLRDSDISLRCGYHVAFKNSEPQPFKVNCTNTNDIYGISLNKKESSHTFFKFLLIIFGVFMLALFISSVYYRYHWTNYKTEPFDPPSFCPNFIYPRNSVY